MISARVAGIALELEQVEQDVERGGADVARVLLLDLPRDLVDLRLVEEVERGVEVLQVHHALRPGRRLFRDLRLALLRRVGVVAAGRIAAGLLRHRAAAFAEELDELVLDELELLLPEQGQQIVARRRPGDSAPG